MIPTNHIQNGADQIYCHKLQVVLHYLPQYHMDTECLNGCPYFAGGYQGDGIECLYYDGTNEPVDLRTDAWTLKKRMETLGQV